MLIMTILREKIIFEISKNEKTTVVYESPHRLKKLLKELVEYCGGEREIIVARELTKKFEEHVGKNINDAIRYFKDKEVKGEITLIIKGIKKENRMNLMKYFIIKIYSIIIFFFFLFFRLRLKVFFFFFFFN